MMKKWILIGIFGLFLTGCAQTTFETLGDVNHQPVVAPVAREVILELPQDTVQAVWEGEDDTLYICDDYTIHLQTLDAADLNSAIRTLSGFDKDALTVLESRCGDHKRYEWVWTAAGEGGDVICRCTLLYDGAFFYAVTVTANADIAGSCNQQWNSLLASFCLEEN